MNWVDQFYSFKKQRELPIKKIVVIDLEKKKIETQTLILYKQEQRVTLFIYDEQNQCLNFYKQIRKHQQKQALKVLSISMHIVRSHTFDKSQCSRLQKLAKEEILKKNIKEFKRNEKIVFVNEEQPIENMQAFEGVKLESVKKLSFKLYKLKSIEWMPKVFPCCEVINLSRNQIINFENSDRWKAMKILHIQYNKITQFPKQLSSLSNLETLNMSNNLLGKISKQMCQLTKLKQLILERNKITEISQNISDLLNLEVLWLKENQLFSIPAVIGQLSKLKSIVLDQNKIKCIPKQIINLSNLELFNINSNLIEELPQQIFTKMPKLKDLWAYQNKISKFPSSIKYLTNLTRFSVFKNNLSEIPAELIGLKKIEYLNISFNQISDLEIMDKMQMKSLIQIRIGNNKISKLMHNITKLKNLKGLCLNSNPLNQLIPQIGNIKKLEQLWAYQIGLQSIPLQICGLKHLKILYLNNNKLKTVPKQITNLRELTMLDLSQNCLEQFPISICELDKLTNLYINSNNFDQIPAQISKLVCLKQLGIYNQKLTKLPLEIEQLQNLELAEVNKNILDESSMEIYERMYVLLYNRFRKQRQT